MWENMVQTGHIRQYNTAKNMHVAYQITKEKRNTLIMFNTYFS